MSLASKDCYAAPLNYFYQLPKRRSYNIQFSNSFTYPSAILTLRISTYSYFYKQKKNHPNLLSAHQGVSNNYVRISFVFVIQIICFILFGTFYLIFDKNRWNLSWSIVCAECLFWYFGFVVLNFFNFKMAV